MIGCLIGASSLLFIDTDKAERLKRAAEARDACAAIVTEAAEALGAKRATLWLLGEGDKLSPMCRCGNPPLVDGAEQNAAMTVRPNSTFERVLRTKEPLRTTEANEGGGQFFRRVDRVLLQDKTRSVVLAPVLGKDGAPIGILEVANKRGEVGGETVPFDHADLRVLSMAAANASGAVGRVEG